MPTVYELLDEFKAPETIKKLANLLIASNSFGRPYVLPPATPAEIHQMKEVLKASVRAGAAGFSTNQNPVHMYADGTPIQSRFATDEEIIELACALGEINQGAIQISRGSLGVSVPMRESVQLFDEISSHSGRPVIWQSITHRWDKPGEWRELLDLAVVVECVPMGCECRDPLRVGARGEFALRVDHGVELHRHSRVDARPLAVDALHLHVQP